MYYKKSEGSQKSVAKDAVLQTSNYSIQRNRIMATTTCKNKEK